MYIKPLKPSELTEMYITFLDSFSDYPIPFKLTKEQFVRKFVQKLKIDFSLSSGAYNYDGALIGFIFTSINFYEGKLAAYNGGTGVRPRHRGHHLTTQMYDYLKPLFEQHNVKQCVLEVLTSNNRAIKAYTNIGFEKTKYFKCFVLESSKLNYAAPVHSEIELVKVKNPNWIIYEKFWDYAPSFLDSSKMVTDNLANETIIEARLNDQCVGYTIFQPAFGRLSQIGIDASHRRKGIGKSLIAYVWQHSVQKKISIINVNDESEKTKSFFQYLGFVNQIDQYEMIMPI